MWVMNKALKIVLSKLHLGLNIPLKFNEQQQQQLICGVFSPSWAVRLKHFLRNYFWRETGNKTREGDKACNLAAASHNLQYFQRKSMLKLGIQLSQYHWCQTQRLKEFKACRPFQIYQSVLGIAVGCHGIYSVDW